MSIRGRLKALVLAALISPMSVLTVFAEPALPSSTVPDSLILELITAPGYEWMKVCTLASGQNARAGDASKSADGVDHAAHHPGQGAAAASPLGGASLAQTIMELRQTIEALEQARRGVESRSP